MFLATQIPTQKKNNLLPCDVPPSYLQVSPSNSSLVLFLSLQQLLTETARVKVYNSLNYILLIFFSTHIQLSQTSHYEKKFSQAQLYSKANLFGKLQ